MRDTATLASPGLARTWQHVVPGTPDQLQGVRAALRTFPGHCRRADSDGRARTVWFRLDERDSR